MLNKNKFKKEKAPVKIGGVALLCAVIAMHADSQGINNLAQFQISSNGVQTTANNAYDTGQYRNLFAEISGKADKEIVDKVTDAYRSMFEGSDNPSDINDPNSERLYYRFSDDEYYILTVNSNDIRSEGVSWGMMIAVLANDQERFNNLWRFAYNHMRIKETGIHPETNKHAIKGTYAWRVYIENGRVKIRDSNPAPDGEEYFATALFNAAARWGGVNQSGHVLNYQEQANTLLKDIREHLMHATEKQVVFAPVGTSAQVTDPSYHLPAFYEYWSRVADGQENRSYWASVADTSRNFLNTHINSSAQVRVRGVDGRGQPNLAAGNGGLATYLADFGGGPIQVKIDDLPNPHDIYEGDAWRVAFNIGMDTHLFGSAGSGSWQSNAINNLYDFFMQENQNGGVCGGGYSQLYHKNGDQFSECGNDNKGLPIPNFTHYFGQKAANGAAAFAATNVEAKQFFVNTLWEDSWPKGRYRYYHGSLQMLALLSASGNFKLYPLAPNN